MSAGREPPPAVRYVVVGAGVHGLSTAWHLAQELRARRGADDPERDVVVVDKTGVAAGASGIACGIVRNNYAQPAMRRLMAHSVSVWESDPAAFSYHPVGYLQAAPEAMHADVVRVHDEQRRIGYDSVLVEGERSCRSYLLDLLGDWRGEGITTVLHEKRGGFADNELAIRGLAAKAEQAGARILTGLRVTGFDVDPGQNGAVRGVVTDHGTIRCEHVVVACGPWIRDLWDMLGLPARIEVADGVGAPHEVDMWSYLLLQEGTLAVPPERVTTAAGGVPPVMHVDSDVPLHDERGELVTDRMWGIYYKPDRRAGGVQGGTMPVPVEASAAEVRVDPYGPASTEFTTPPGFARMWTTALAHCQDRFDGTGHLYRDAQSGGLGCFTPDSFPVFDTFRGNAYVIADSNHGFKMIGVGALVAAELLGEPQELLAPFRFDRFARGELHPTSKSPFPWS